MKKIYFVIAGCSLTVLAMVFNQCGTKEVKRNTPDESGNPEAWTSSINENASDMMDKGKAVFRYETFGDEAFWTDQLQLHKVLVSEKHGGTGMGLLPKD